MNPEMSPETTVLVDYANENLRLKLDNARLRAELQSATVDKAEPGEDTAPTAG